MVHKLIGKLLRFMVLSWISVVAFQGFTQTLVPVIIGSLPNTVQESSGLEYMGGGTIWTHNDSGDSARVFLVSTSGALLHTVDMTTTAIDFEDVASDAVGNIYVGDFGNNLSDRQDLVVYKILNPGSNPPSSVAPEEIHFTFDDQMNFPPTNTLHAFDCEALFHHGNHLYLVSKHGGSAYSRLYQLPDTAGTHQAVLLDSTFTLGPVTAADISASGDSVLLLSYGNLYLLTGYPAGQFFSGAITSYSLPLSQTEGITFGAGDTLYMSNEEITGFGGDLYYLSLSAILASDPVQIPEVKVYPNPIVEGYIVVDLPQGDAFHLQLMDMHGRVMLDRNVTNLSRIELAVSHLAKGSYILRVAGDTAVFTKILTRL